MIFRVSLIFLICLVWFRYFVSDFTLSIVYTVLTTLIIEILIHFLAGKRQNKLNLKSSELKHASQIALTFALDSEKALNFLFDLAKQKHKTEKKKNYILIKNKNVESGQDYFNILLPYFKLENFSKNDLAKILNTLKNVQYEKLIICSGAFSKDVFSFIKTLRQKIILLDAENAYNNLYKKYNFFPNELVELKQDAKIKLKDFFSLALNKQRSKGYFFASIILLISSFLFRMNLYYVISSSILLILCLVSYFLPKFSNVLPEEIL